MNLIKRAIGWLTADWPNRGLSRSAKASRVARAHGLDSGTVGRLGTFCNWRMDLMVALAVLGDASARDPVEIGRLVFGYNVPAERRRQWDSSD